MTQPQGSYLSIDDVSFDPSFDDVSSGVQRSSRSSLAGTSVTSAADISTTFSITASQKLPANGADEDVDVDDARSISRSSALSIEKDPRIHNHHHHHHNNHHNNSNNSRENGQRTPTTFVTVSESAVVHYQRPDEPIPPSPSDTLLLTPTFSSAPSPTSARKVTPSPSPPSLAYGHQVDGFNLSPETPTNSDLPVLTPVETASASSSSSFHFRSSDIVSIGAAAPAETTAPASSASARSPIPSPTLPPFQISRIEECRPQSRVLLFPASSLIDI